MTTEGIEAVFLETHNWGRMAKFLQGLGFTVEFETDHHSGQFRNGDGPSVFVAEVPATQPARTQLVLKVASSEERPGEGVDIVTGFEPTHYGTQEMTVRDPDGRSWSLQAPGKE
ncbi:VOC family protein [Nocardia sp. NPDC004573]